ncbi:MAG: DNA-directed RNA polymerase subunit A' [Candidatus Altiarchaeota archaeon]|nr:DNA-directed RNA polymerase subunit A' [Candidatus Altiarchaeota archaeon]
MQIIKKEVGGIRFSMLGPEVTRKLSIMEIIVPELYDQDGFPVEGGLMDPRLGVIDPGVRCKTCGGRVGQCPGHFGSIEIAKPVVHIRLGKEIYNWLHATCQNCGRLRLSQTRREFYLSAIERSRREGTVKDEEKMILGAVKEAKKSDGCSFCGEKKPKIVYEKPTTYYVDDEKMTPIQVRDWLEKIPEADLPLLGLNPETAKPEWAIMTVVPVSPVTVRPSITLETGERSEDDLTHKLVDIMRINMRLKENMASGAPAVIIEDLWELLQYHVTTLIDNEVSGVPPARHRAGRVLKGIVQRLKTKEGRFRRNLAGKRVNFSARTVISPDSRIGINEVGIPEQIAKTLTVSVHVTERNNDYLKEMVKNGEEELHGVNYVIDDQATRLRVTDFNKETLAEQIEPGWLVERHLMDGDVVLMNRQPSLHRMSIMGHRVRVLPGRTFRIHPSVCPPYNADFDGDEMNLHDPQGEEVRAEAYHLMEVKHHLRSPRFGGVIIGAWRTQISGLFLLTKQETVLSRKNAFQILHDAGIDPTKLGNKQEFTGKELFSTLLPNDLSMSFSSNAASSGKLKKGDREVVIKKGKLISGVIDNNAVGAFSGKIIDRIIQEYGSDMGVDFVNKVSLLGLVFLSYRGMTVGMDDFKVSDKVRADVELSLAEAETDVEKKIKSYHKGNLKPWPGMTAQETLENQIINRLNKGRDSAVELVTKHLSVNNPAVIMAISGARGKLLNLGLMAGAIGQQSIGGGRPNRVYYGNRTFPHFKPNDLGTRSKGFVHDAYGTGLDPFEFFWVSAAGREGLTDTGIKTPKSGYMYRRLSNALQDLKVDYDHSVRDGSGTIVQFLYGEDGIDPNRSDWGSIDMERIAEVIKDAT